MAHDLEALEIAARNGMQPLPSLVIDLIGELRETRVMLNNATKLAEQMADQRDARPDGMLYSSVCEDRDNARTERDEMRLALVEVLAALDEDDTRFADESRVSYALDEARRLTGK